MGKKDKKEKDKEDAPSLYDDIGDMTEMAYYAPSTKKKKRVEKD